MDSVKPNPKRTGAGNHLHTENMGSYDLPADFKLPEVDMEEAAAIRPSRLTGKNVTWLVLFVSGMGFTMFGYDQGVLSSLLTLDSFRDTFPSTASGFGTAQSLLVAVYQLGCMTGALLNLYVGDKLGRIKTLYVAGIGIIVGTILQAASINYGMMIFARIFNGIFNGMLTSTVPTYQSECSRPERRGPDVMISATVNIFGLMCSYWVGLAFYYTEGQISWRFPVAFQCVFTFAMVFAMWGFRSPESPRWLAAKGRHAESIAVLAALQNAPVDDPEVLRTWTGIVELNAQSVGDFAIKELGTHGTTQHFRRTMLGVLAQAFQQLSGINLITYYLTSVLEDNMGLDGEMSRIIAGVNGTCYFLTAAIAIFVIERLGRRNLLLWTAILMGATMAILAGLYEEVYSGNTAAQVISVLCLFLFNSWFSVGWLGMTWLYPAEITPLRIRAPANGLSTASNWLFNFFVVMATGPMFATIRWGTYVFFAALNFVLIFPVVYLYFPETRGKSLEELDVLFAYANTNHKNAVKLSLGNEVPKPGSRAAEAAVGNVEMGEVNNANSRHLNEPTETREDEVDVPAKQTV